MARTSASIPSSSSRPAGELLPGAAREAQVALVLVGIVFLVLQLALTPWPFGLSTDEATYLAMVYPDAPEIYWASSRAWGMPVLAAPVAVFSADVGVVRAWFALLSSGGLVAAFWPWLRVLRPPSVAPLAALLFATSWVAVFFGLQVYPNLYVGLGAVAAAGLYVRAVEEPAWWRLLLVALAVGFVALVRPVDSVLVVAPVLGIALAVSRLRRREPLAALCLGGVLGWIPWIVESFVRFEDPLTRLEAAEQAGPDGLRPDLDFVLAFPRLLDGVPQYFRGEDLGAAGPLQWPFLAELAVGLVLVAVGIGVAAEQRRRAEVGMVTGSAVLVLAFYLVLPSFTSIRFVLPAFPLLALPVAVALVRAGRLGGGARRRVLAGLVVLGVVAHAVLMLVKSDGMFERHGTARAADLAAASALRPSVDGRTCLVVGESSVLAFYLRCRAQGALPTDAPPPRVTQALEQRAFIVAVLSRPPDPDGYLAEWERLEVPGLPAPLRAYVPPEGSRPDDVG